MKLRLRGNSVRLRVNQREVDTLAAGGALEERLLFPGGASLLYILEPAAESQAVFREGTIRVSAPRKQFDEWARGDGIGIYFELPAGNSSLRIAIEKDLECVEGPPDEKDPHAFPRGQKAC